MRSEEEEIKEAWSQALRLLEASAKSSSELEKKLRLKKVRPEIIDCTIHKLERIGFLDDRKLAQHVVSRYTSSKPSGRHRIQFELKRRGIPESILNDMLEGLSEDEESERAAELAASLWVKWTRLPEEKRNTTIMNYLLRRGFSFEAARKALTGVSKKETEDVF